MPRPELSDQRIAGSFRDPSGFLFNRGGVLYRQVNRVFGDHYATLISSGLYKHLRESGLMISHEEVDLAPADSSRAYKIIKPALVPFISYPYEWCFSQLKDAALATLEIQKIAIEFGMSLKDASSYNIQFLSYQPILIDTLSFEKYKEGRPWVAYRQFCQHFLAPLALMCHTDIRLSQLLRVHIDGIPLDLASILLPIRTRFSFSLLTHIHIHARSQARYADKGGKARDAHLTRMGMLGLIDSLQSAVRKLNWKPAGTEWAEYYSETNYSERAASHKESIVREFLSVIKPNCIWDLGANTGRYSRVPAHMGISTLSFDVDPAAVERNYIECRRHRETSILPLVVDLTNPSPAIGWHHAERRSLLERGPADAVLALALIHHLAISNNVPLPILAEFFRDMTRTLIIEFVPKTDSQVQRLLASREDIFTDYSENDFLEAFGRFFRIDQSVPIDDSKRSLHLCIRKADA